MEQRLPSLSDGILGRRPHLRQQPRHQRHGAVGRHGPPAVQSSQRQAR